MKLKIDGFKITQNVGDLMAGYRYNDFSRISAYQGRDLGLHTGATSPTLGRHGQPFGERQTTLKEFGC